MNVGSTRRTVTELAWCSSCDLPLRRKTHTLTGTVSWRTRLGKPVQSCPRCFAWLPEHRPEDIQEVNEILAEMGEPPTCAEEMERGPWAGGRSAA